MRIVHDPKDFEDELQSSRREALKSFGTSAWIFLSPLLFFVALFSIFEAEITVSLVSLYLLLSPKRC